MYEDFFANRIALLREKKNISAREMSLSIGQNSSYINRIENKQTFPSMRSFFYICEYLDISPKDFFDTESSNPFLIDEILQELKTLDVNQLNVILAVSKALNHK
ncbi:MAG: helix-turn-helix transcriptional regulator [Lachnospiraceae bacterium]|nr:helix-turn-helix transcriptional regulator [Lachnospiraceae bacterium]